MQIFNSRQEFMESAVATGLPDPEIARRVADIIASVRKQGDSALLDFTERFDSVRLSQLRTPKEQIVTAASEIQPDLHQNLLSAIARVKRFHQKQIPESWFERDEDGSQFGMKYTPIRRVGIYVPGGTAGYPSTVIMTVVPAQLAGVEEIAIVSPPGKNGGVNPYVLAAASLLSVDEVYAVGGAQAIAALACGTESIPGVDKIVGPGNAYVNEAKRQVYGQVGIDQLAGPTELVVLADQTAHSEYIVRDLLAQAEHDPQARSLFITTSEKLAKEVPALLEKRISQADRRDILRTALENYGVIVRVEDLHHGVEIINRVAPEHVEILTDKPEALLPEIYNAGAICLGEYTPAVVGDYFAGPNHVLPTGGTARFASPLNVLDFMKFSSLLSYSKSRFSSQAEEIASVAELENLPNHREAVLCRR